jgi:hypothetical protein
MNSPEKNTNKENPTKLLEERDVLGLEKSQDNTNKTPSHPNRIFIAVGCLIIIAIIYWLYNH